MLLAGVLGPNRLCSKSLIRCCRLPLAPSLFHGLKGGYPALTVGHGVAQSISLGCCGTRPDWASACPVGMSSIVA